MQTKVSGFHPPSPRPLLAQVSAGLPRGLARLSQVKTRLLITQDRLDPRGAEQLYSC